MVAFLDRVNFGYAALEMNSALNLSAEVFESLSGIFFIGPSLVGSLSKATGSTDAGLVAIGACLVFYGLLTHVVRTGERLR